MFKITITLIFILVTAHTAISQSNIIELNNPSFEEEAGKSKVQISGWLDCGALEFPRESPPDIHPSNLWQVKAEASHGSTYLGLVTRDNDSYESLCQKLSQPLKEGSCYAFSFDASQSEKYRSPSRLKNQPDKLYNYKAKTVVRIWGSNSINGKDEMLYKSKAITNSDWEKVHCVLSPSSNYAYIRIEAFYDIPVMLPTNGHVLIDNCSAIEIVDCSE